MAERRLDASALRAFAAAVLRATGVPVADAALVADSLVTADLRGIGSHGLMRLAPYVRRLERGGTNPRPHLRTLRERGAAVVIDGDHGLGQVVGAFAMRAAMARADLHGLGMATVMNSEHFGTAGTYAEQAAGEGMIGVACTNVPPVMAAWGGRGGIIGNNPIAVAVPTRVPPLIVLDMAMSRVAGGRVRLAEKRREAIPEGWIVDADGAPTTNPRDFTMGALLPDGHKAYGLAVIVEVLSGVLAGAGTLSGVSSYLQEPERATNTGHAFIAIEVTHFMDREAFLDRVEAMRRELQTSPVAVGNDRVRLPGELEAEREAAAGGIVVVPEDVVRDMVDLAERFGIEAPISQY
jgi:LDH2 family malate/lactate/ureidoglycolate dehydrogenase